MAAAGGNTATAAAALGSRHTLEARVVSRASTTDPRTGGMVSIMVMYRPPDQQQPSSSSAAAAAGTSAADGESASTAAKSTVDLPPTYDSLFAQQQQQQLQQQNEGQSAAAAEDVNAPSAASGAVGGSEDGPSSSGGNGADSVDTDAEEQQPLTEHQRQQTHSVIISMPQVGGVGAGGSAQFAEGLSSGDHPPSAAGTLTLKMETGESGTDLGVVGSEPLVAIGAQQRGNGDGAAVEHDATNPTTDCLLNLEV